MTQPEKPEAAPTAKAGSVDSGTVRIAVEDAQKAAVQATPASSASTGSSSGSTAGSPASPASGTAAGSGKTSGTTAGTSASAGVTAATAGTTPIAKSGSSSGGVTSGMIKADGSEVTSSAPPPWQRVAEDNRYAEEHAVAPVEDKPRFEDWGYQRSPRSEAYPSADQPTVNTYRPPADPGRTTVNLGAGPTQSPRVGSPAAPSAQPSALRRPGRGPRRASLQVKRVDPWSVLKLAFVLAVALFLVWMVAVGVLYGVLDGMGVWDKLNGTYTEFAQNTSSGSSGPLITAGRVLGIAAIIGAINIVLITALCTVGAFVYNVSADLAGGLEITLAERE